MLTKSTFTNNVPKIKTCTSRIVCPDDILTCKLKVTNNSSHTKEEVVLLMPYPFGLSCMEFSRDGGTAFEHWFGSYTIGNMPANSSLELLLRGIVDIDITGHITFQARVFAQTMSDLQIEMSIADVSPPAIPHTLSCEQLQEISQLVKIIAKASIRLESVCCCMLNGALKTF